MSRRIPSSPCRSEQAGRRARSRRINRPYGGRPGPRRRSPPAVGEPAGQQPRRGFWSHRRGSSAAPARPTRPLGLVLLPAVQPCPQPGHGRQDRSQIEILREPHRLVSACGERRSFPVFQLPRHGSPPPERRQLIKGRPGRMVLSVEVIGGASPRERAATHTSRVENSPLADAARRSAAASMISARVR